MYDWSYNYPKGTISYIYALIEIKKKKKKKKKRSPQPVSLCPVKVIKTSGGSPTRWPSKAVFPIWFPCG